MDLNDDGRQDLLSGSYSGTKANEPMAGLFQVLWGAEGGGFRKAAVLTGTDGKPLAIAAAGEDGDIRRICTRPFAVDWEGDGDLDLVSGNFAGTIVLFRGEGKGRFGPAGEFLKAGEAELKVEGMHSDPFVVDWDGDGDLDLLSGSAQGGVQWAANRAGKGQEPQFDGFKTLVAAPAAREGEEAAVFETAAPVVPADSTRVWAADVNGDGKLDLLVGDSTVLTKAAAGLTEEQFKQKEAEWRRKLDEISKGFAEGGGDGGPSQELMRKFSAHHQARREFLVETRTGFVWLYQGK